MKKVLLSILLFFVLLVLAAGFTSCEKTSPAPVNPATPVVNNTPAQVQYRIMAEGSNLTIRYTAFENGMMTTVEKFILRTEDKVFVDIPRNNQVSFQAWNTDGDRKDISIEIYSDGVIQTSASLNYNTGIATASAYIY